MRPIILQHITYCYGKITKENIWLPFLVLLNSVKDNGNLMGVNVHSNFVKFNFFLEF